MNDSANKEKNIWEHADKLRRNDLGIFESELWEPLAQFIVQEYGQDSAPRRISNLGLTIMAIYDDHGVIDVKAMKRAIERKPDFIVFGGDHSPSSILRISEETLGIEKYYVKGNHDGPEIDDTFRYVGATDLHGQVVETPQGIRLGGIAGSHIYRSDREWRTMFDHYESLEVARVLIDKLKSMASGLDILVSHDSSFVQTWDPKRRFDDGASHVGLISNTMIAYYHNPDYGITPPHIFIHGHTHENKKEMLSNGVVEYCIYGIRTIKC